MLLEALLHQHLNSCLSHLGSWLTHGQIGLGNLLEEGSQDLGHGFWTSGHGVIWGHEVESGHRVLRGVHMVMCSECFDNKGMPSGFPLEPVLFSLEFI